ncbi:hypothetical protein L1987_77837 [Smallanthus sonchifolius]|uniref:Uncharacterized protein n=1 Tax=Smallanthus sonchifolius TaxID=185202 RepID=A0ACB8ZC02_9ASTR|nr:hypothetical protein L1987_77837 [Smallanthus sonchifolius]
MQRGRRHGRGKNTTVDDDEASRQRDKLREDKEKITRGDYRSGAKRGVNNNQRHITNELETTLFLTNLPDDASTLMLWNSFRHLPNMSDAFVPQKKDRRGNIFGFIRFETVKNVDYLINEVKNVRVGSAKIGVNASKFSRNNYSIPSVPTAKPSHRPRPQPENNYMSPPHHNNVGNSFGENSYRAALTGKASSNEQTMKVDISTCNIRNKVWGGHSLIGVAVNLEVVNNIKNYLQKPIYPDIGVRYIGGLKVLLMFKTEEEIQAFMIEEEKSHGKFFSVLEQWENQVYNYDRVAWLTIFGSQKCSTPSVLSLVR